MFNTEEMLNTALIIILAGLFFKLIWWILNLPTIHIGKTYTPVEYEIKIREIFSDLESQLADLKKNNDNTLLIDKWEKEVKELMKGLLTNIDDYDEDEMAENITDFKEEVKSGILQIKYNKNPFEKSIFFKENEDSKGMKKIGIIVVISWIIYMISAVMCSSVFVLTIMYAILLFPRGIPYVREKTGIPYYQNVSDIQYSCYIAVMVYLGWKLNQYVFEQSFFMIGLWFVGLPIIYGVVYWKVKAHKWVRRG